MCTQLALATASALEGLFEFSALHMDFPQYPTNALVD